MDFEKMRAVLRCLVCETATCYQLCYHKYITYDTLLQLWLNCILIF